MHCGASERHRRASPQSQPAEPARRTPYRDDSRPPLLAHGTLDALSVCYAMARCRIGSRMLLCPSRFFVTSHRAERLFYRRITPVHWTEPKLLIADDDRDFRESLAEVFQRRGYNTKLASDGEEAVQIVQASRELHLVILDVHMPRLTGLEALEMIRQSVVGSLPCILMSAKLDDTIVQQAQQLQIASLLSKPFKLREVTSTVERILQSAYGWKL
jgi:CheY-like chemotaxis protein